jgi:hypothetical protein
VRFEDEGTYVAQARAIEQHGKLTHYTYWYDHPPAGWIQIASYSALTNADNRYYSAVTAGREFMLVMHVITLVLLFLLARRLGLGSLASAVGTLAYGLSPLVIEFSRYVLLDNIAVPWLLGAFVLALSPRRHLRTAIGAAICMSMAVLSKETFLVLLPVLIYGLWTYGDKRNRRYLMTAFGVVFTMLTGTYILYAVLKNELLPGPNHVSLMGSLAWQLFGRPGSGSIFTTNTGANGLMKYWLNIDQWLLLVGSLCLPVVLFVRRLRPVALALLIGLLMLLRTGYLPYPYVIALLPFAALCIAGFIHHSIVLPLKSQAHSATYRHWARVASLAMMIGAMIFVVPTWFPKLEAADKVDQDVYSRQVIDWAATHIDPSSKKRLIVESAYWSDLEAKGFDQPDPVWLYKTETDPAVAKQIGGWRGIDYLILDGPTVSAKDFDQAFPTVSQAIKHSRVVATFGKDNQEILVYQVNKH